MPPSLAHNLNKTVFVSIPSLFGNELIRACTLAGIEPGGVWLQGGDLPFTANANIFIPFAQVTYLLDSTPKQNPYRAPGPRTSESRGPGTRTETRSKRKK